MSPQYLRTLTTVFAVVVLGLIVSSCSDDGYPAPSEQAMQEIKRCKEFGGDTRVATWIDSNGVLKTWISCRKIVVISSQ